MSTQESQICKYSNEVARLAPECVRKPVEVVDPEVSLTTLYVTDVRTIETREMRELLLRDALRHPMRSNLLAERHPTIEQRFRRHEFLHTYDAVARLTLKPRSVSSENRPRESSVVS